MAHWFLGDFFLAVQDRRFLQRGWLGRVEVVQLCIFFERHIHAFSLFVLHKNEDNCTIADYLEMHSLRIWALRGE